MSKKILSRRWIKITILLFFYDVIAINAAYGAALFFGFDMDISAIPPKYLDSWLYFSPFFTILTCGLFISFKLYQSIWRYAGIYELGRLTIAGFFSFVIQIIGTCIFFIKMPITYYILGGLLAFIFVVSIRFSSRFTRLLFRRLAQNGKGSRKRVMIIGAGEAGKILIWELQASKTHAVDICCIIDDNDNKTGRVLDHIPIIGTSQEIPTAVLKYNIDRIILAIPSASSHDKRRIINICKETQCELQILPGISQILNGHVKVNFLRDVSVEDLLGRDAINVDLGEIASYIKGKRLLVTGGGGSIGGELSRQIALYEPEQLILLDIYENGIYEIQQELMRDFPMLNLNILIGSVQDESRMQGIMGKYRPDIVFHAAAHKHVPLLEDSPNEAIKNNVLGTYIIAKAAVDWHVKRFVLISTDKAVNPTNIMGASKRLCEMVIQTMDGLYETEFAAVRFGNVLGSNGSVVPLFQKQIAAGGPLTVTHPEVTRYFMTIPEAVSLVLQAGVYARHGQIFVLDMGEPIKIDDLARNMIKLSGLEPDQDIQIEYIGLRPGEKLYEELLLTAEGLGQTENKLIFVGQPLEIIPGFLQQIERLKIACNNETDQVRVVISEIVPEYQYRKSM